MTIPEATQAVLGTVNSLNQTAGNATQLAGQLFEQLCTGNRSEALLRFSDPASMDDALTALCSLNQSQFTQVVQDVQQDLNATALGNQVGSLGYFFFFFLLPRFSQKIKNHAKQIFLQNHDMTFSSKFLIILEPLHCFFRFGQLGQV